MKLSQTHVLARTTARTCGDGCSYLQGRLHVLAGTVKRTCGKRGSALQGRMQCTAEAIPDFITFLRHYMAQNENQ